MRSFDTAHGLKPGHPHERNLNPALQTLFASTPIHLTSNFFQLYHHLLSNGEIKAASSRQLAGTLASIGIDCRSGRWDENGFDINLWWQVAWRLDLSGQGCEVNLVLIAFDWLI